MRETFADVLVGGVVNLTGRLMDVAPRVSALVVFVGLGALGAWAIGGMARAILRATEFDRAVTRWEFWRWVRLGGIDRPPSALVGDLLGGAIFAMAALLGLDAVELPGAGSVTSVLLAVLPRALGSGLVVLLGFLGGSLGALVIRVLWARRDWRRADLAGRVTAWTVRAAAIGFALIVLGVPPIAIVIAPTVPMGVILLGATLGVAQVARLFCQRAAHRWLQRLQPAGEAIGSCDPETGKVPAAAAATALEPAGAAIRGYPRFRSSED